MRSLGAREQLSLPLPKPAPSASLPELPSRPRPSKLMLTFSAHRTAPQADNQVLSPDNVAFSPSLESSPMLSPGKSRSWFPLSPSSTPPLTTASEFSVESSNSAISPSIPFPTLHHRASRQRNHSAALAALEGKSPSRPTHSRRSSNFISLTDEEESGICSRDEEQSWKRPCKASEDAEEYTDVRRNSSFMRLRSRVDSYLASISFTSFIDLQ